MRGFFVFLILITIVMLGLAGCPKKTDTAGQPPVNPTAGDTSGGESATDGGE